MVTDERSETKEPDFGINMPKYSVQCKHESDADAGGLLPCLAVLPVVQGVT